MAAETAGLVRFASSADITARFTGADWGEPHSGAVLAKAFVDGRFTRGAGRDRPAAVAAMAIELAIEEYLKSLGPMPARPRAAIACALHLRRGRIADLIAEDWREANKVKEALTRIEDWAAHGSGSRQPRSPGGTDETGEAR